MTTLNYQPDYSARKKIKPRIQKMQYGDGYEQRYTDGLNTSLEEWSLTFKRPPATITAIDDFLKARNSVEAFHWTTPSGRDAVFVCEEHDIDYQSIGWWVLSCTLREVPEAVSA